MRKVSPASSHGMTVRLLRLIEHNQRLWHWAHTKEAKDETTAPEPILLDGEEGLMEALREREEQRAGDVAAALGIEL